MIDTAALTRETRQLTIDGARTIVQAAARHAQSLSLPVTIAVTDAAGRLLMLERLDDAPFASIQVAQDKAFSAASTKTPTDAWYTMAQDDPEFGYGLKSIDRLTPLAGGIPLLSYGVVVGAIGVSGGSNAQDRAIAQEGATALG
ncbi:GlcG/HbpS family heme-binding protein [Microbacterium rhizomatis]|uniref:Heme-binding protein n=1 Tax=Microbacterium rhizomatis TaxID=1631477 RepID=A0A5J5IWL7_9MICO|nr:heme-binding protein [Microbacterium rhizomatis]KAA9104522.1 heme-binding protein [Microbacterium rhizomatis]